MRIEVNKDLIQVLIFGKFWYCSLIKSLEYVRLKVLLFNFYPIWRCKKKLAWHRIFLAIYLSSRRNQRFCEKKRSNFWRAPSQENIIEWTWYFSWDTHLYMSLFLCPSVCPSRTIFQEPYIIWSLFFVHMCEIMIYPDVFFHFFKFWCFGSLGG